MIKVVNESSTRDSIELKFNSIKDMLNYINDDEILDEWDDNDSEVYLRIVDKNTVTTSISIGVDRFSPGNDVQATITIGKKTYGPKIFDRYYEVVKWIKSVFNKI